MPCLDRNAGMFHPRPPSRVSHRSASAEQRSRSPPPRLQEAIVHCPSMRPRCCVCSSHTLQPLAANNAVHAVSNQQCASLVTSSTSANSPPRSCESWERVDTLSPCKAAVVRLTESNLCCAPFPLLFGSACELLQGESVRSLRVFELRQRAALQHSSVDDGGSCCLPLRRWSRTAQLAAEQQAEMRQLTGVEARPARKLRRPRRVA